MQRCRTVCAYAILNTFGAGALFSAVIALYGIKSALGIDIFEGPSFLHQFVY